MQNNITIILAKYPKIFLLLEISVGICLFLLCGACFAYGGVDLLAGTTDSAISTMSGTGKYWAYIIDGAISLAAFAKTKNPFIFASVLGVALGITVILKLAGG